MNTQKKGRQLVYVFVAAVLLSMAASAEFDYIGQDDEPRVTDKLTPYELSVPSVRTTDRIGWSADGNNNDPDDWCATPVALCIIAASGYRDQLVHFSYNNRLDQFNTKKMRENNESTLGAATRFGLDTNLFYDLWASDTNTGKSPANALRPGHAASGVYPGYDAAFESAIQEVLASSETNRFFWIQAGPFEFAYRVLQEAVTHRGATAENLRNTILVSHSGVNEQSNKWRNEIDAISGNKRAAAGAQMCVEEYGVGFYFTGAQGRDRFGSKTNMEAWDFVAWMKDSDDEAFQWMHNRFVVFTDFFQNENPKNANRKGLDASDAGMAYTLLMGDYNGNLAKFSGVVSNCNWEASGTAPVASND